MNSLSLLNTSLIKLLPSSLCGRIIVTCYSTDRHDKNHYDIVIAGGGMVGNTLACAIGKWLNKKIIILKSYDNLGKNPRLSQKRILVLEASKEKKWSYSEKYSNRVVSLSPGTYKLLNDLGAWDFIAKNRFATIKRLQVISIACRLELQ